MKIGAIDPEAHQLRRIDVGKDKVDGCLGRLGMCASGAREQAIRSETQNYETNPVPESDTPKCAT
jgi:hypothetical protein